MPSAKWLRWLLRDDSIAPLLWLRTGYGLISIFSLLGILSGRNSYLMRKVAFHYSGWEYWSTTASVPFFLWAAAGCAAAVMVIVGLHYRVAALVLFVVHLRLFVLEKCHYLNHDYLMCWIAALMVLVPAHAAFSEDATAGRIVRRTRVPAIHADMFRLLLCLVYWYSGISKLNSSWLSGQQCRYWLTGYLEQHGIASSESSLPSAPRL